MSAHSKVFVMPEQPEGISEMWMILHVKLEGEGVTSRAGFRHFLNNGLP